MGGAVHSIYDNGRIMDEGRSYMRRNGSACVRDGMSDITRAGVVEYPLSSRRNGRGGEGRQRVKSSYSNPYSTAMRHASLAFLFAEACCLRPRGDEKSSSQAGHECALSVERGDLRGVWEVTESLLAKSPSGVFRFWEGEAGRAEWASFFE